MGGVSNVYIDRNNSLYINTIGAAISTFETLPSRVLTILTFYKLREIERVE